MPKFLIHYTGKKWIVAADGVRLSCDEVQLNVSSVTKPDGFIEAFGTIREQHRDVRGAGGIGHIEERILIVSEF